MKPTYWTWYAHLAAGVVLALGMAPAVLAQESLEERLARQEKQIEEIRKNAEVLQKQNEALMKLLSSGPASTPASPAGPAPLAADDVPNIVNGYLQEKEAQQKAAQAVGSTDADGKYKIGSDLRM